LYDLEHAMSAVLKRTEKDILTKQLAYSTFEIKAIDEEKREIDGVASTPAPDRMDDIVEPLGAEYELPIPFLWQHESRDVAIGWVYQAKPDKSGIPVRIRMATIAEAGPLKDKLDYCWQAIKNKLVRGLSIGFKPVEYAEIAGSWGVRYTKWAWLELSAVTIPANQEASITAIKSFAARARTASGARGAPVVIALPTSPGAAGSIVANGKGNSMKTIKEQISALEATRAAKAARMAEIQKTATEAGVTKDAAQREEFDTLASEIEQVDAELKDLALMEKLNVGAATAVTDTKRDPGLPANKTPHIAVIQTKLEPGVRFARMAMAMARSKALQKNGHLISPDEIYRNEKRWMDTAPEVHLALKAAVNANDSTTAAGASEWAYANNIASEFIEYLRPRTLIGRIQGWRNVPFNVRVGGMDGGTTGYWVGQGLAIPLSRPTSTSTTLGITKVAGLTVITKELAMLSTPSAEMMIRNDLVKAIQQKADTSLIDPNNGGLTNVTPASLTYGATARQASGTDFAAFKADWKAMTSNFYANNISLAGSVLVMKEELAEALSMMVTSLGLPQFPSMQDWADGNGKLMGRPVFVTQVADTSGSPDFDNMLILIQPNEVFLADDGGASVEASDQVSLEMDNAPANKSTPTATGASLVSMFQTESIAIKGIRHVNWAKARAQACQYIRSAAYV
jgi:HK97 family phage major capsid protein/HK97 family phage prohead protease